MAAKNTLQFFLGPLLKKFFQDMGRDPNNLEMILIKQKAGQLLKDSNKIINFPQKRSFKEEIDAMKKSGDIVDEDNIIISEKITDRDMFNNSFLNKPTIEGQMEKITGASNRIKEIQKEIDEMYRPKTDAEIKAKFDKQNQESIQRFKDKMKKDEPEDKATGGRIGFSGGKGVMAILKNLLKVKPSGDDLKDFLSKRQFMKDIVGNTEKNKKARDLQMLKEAMDEARKNPGFKFPEITKEEIEKKIAPILLKDRKLNATGGRAGFYTGGITDVEPSLDDIGHGADAMMARTRLMSPGSQTTTSTGLNYLLAEDNDNMRIPFSAGGDAGRRAFLKLLAALTGGAAAVKSGIIGLGEGTTKKAITETIKQSAGTGTPPPYFFKLVDKIKSLGDETLATKDKAIARKYKDYVMEEDFSGNIEIIKKGDDVAEDVYMSYKVEEVPTKVGKKSSAKAEEYEEFTARPDAEGKMKDIEQGVPDSVVMEVEAGSGNVPESFYKGPNKIKKADGGRIGYNIGGLSKLGITGSSRKFLEKVFGKEKFARMIENDPELHRGMLEVVEMFRSKDKEGLKMYMQKFLPHMDDKMVEDFIIGSGDISGIEGQLIRLGSGRDYAGKLEMMKKADNMRKLDALDIDKMKPNAEGGRITFDSGGSPLQRLRQEIVDSMKGYAPADVTEDQLQLVVKDITLDMTPEQAQASALSNFRKLFGMAKGGLAGMLGE